MSENTMHIAMTQGSGHVEYHEDVRWVFKPRKVYEVPTAFGMALIKSTKFAVADPGEDRDQAERRAKAAALIERLAGLDNDTLDKYNALLDAAVSQKAAEVTPKPAPKAAKAPAKKSGLGARKAKK